MMLMWSEVVEVTEVPITVTPDVEVDQQLHRRLPACPLLMRDVHMRNYLPSGLKGDGHDITADARMMLQILHLVNVFDGD